MARKKADPKVRQEMKRRRTGMFLSFFMICLLILLSSSFVLRYVYRGAGNITITPEGITEVYRAATGQSNFDVIEPDQEYEYDFTEDTEEFTYSDEDDEDNYNPDSKNNSNSNSNNSPGFTDGSGVYNNQNNNSNNQDNSKNQNSNSNNHNSNSNNTQNNSRDNSNV